MFGGGGGIWPDIGGINFEEDLLIQMSTGTCKIISTLVGLVSVLIHIGAHLYTERGMGGDNSRKKTFFVVCSRQHTTTGSRGVFLNEVFFLNDFLNELS